MVTDHDIVTAMRTFGGSFIRALAAAYQAADAPNQQRIKDAFADEWENYAAIVRLHRERRRA